LQLWLKENIQSRKPSFEQKVLESHFINIVLAHPVTNIIACTLLCLIEVRFKEFEPRLKHAGFNRAPA